MPVTRCLPEPFLSPGLLASSAARSRELLRAMIGPSREPACRGRMALQYSKLTLLMHLMLRMHLIR